MGMKKGKLYATLQLPFNLSSIEYQAKISLRWM